MDRRSTLLTLAFLLAAGCTDRPRLPNVILISLDTVRADHLSVYGYHRPTTPNLSRLAQGVLSSSKPLRRLRGRSPPT